MPRRMARICYWRYIVPLAVIFQDIETGVDQEVDPDMRLLLLSPSSFNVGLTALRFTATKKVLSHVIFFGLYKLYL
jgi:hypothetical protein